MTHQTGDLDKVDLDKDTSKENAVVRQTPSSKSDHSLRGSQASDSGFSAASNTRPSSIDLALRINEIDDKLGPYETATYVERKGYMTPPTTPEGDPHATDKYILKSHSKVPPPSANSYLTANSSFSTLPRSDPSSGHTGSSGEKSATVFNFDESPLRQAEISIILEELIIEHLKRDKNWEPSGRYPTIRRSLAQMEDEISKTLDKKKKAKQEARRVLELFIEQSLRTDPEFKPSGRHKPLGKKKQVREPSTPLASEDEASKSQESTLTRHDSRSDGSMRSMYYTASSRPLSPILDMSVNESSAQSSTTQTTTKVTAGGSMEVVKKRNSYYNAVQEDECLDSIEDGLSHIALAQMESFSGSADSSPISLIALDPGTTTTFDVDNSVTTTDVTSGHGWVNVHTHMERTEQDGHEQDDEPSTSSETESEYRARKKKSLFTRALERVSFQLRRHILERSDSKSEGEQSVYSVKPKRKIKKRKMKKSAGKPAKSQLMAAGSTFAMTTDHTHHIALHGHAMIEGEGKGLNASALRQSDSESQSELKRHGILNKVKVTKKSKNSAAEMTVKEKQKQKDENVRVLNEMLKEHKKKKKSIDRSESQASNDSIFKRFSLRKPNNQVIPKNSSSKGSKKLASNSFSSEHQQPQHIRSEIKKTDTFRSSDYSTGSKLVVPQVSGKSKSAEELPSPSSNMVPPVLPQHIRSHSDQDRGYGGPMPAGAGTANKRKSQTIERDSGLATDWQEQAGSPRTVRFASAPTDHSLSSMALRAEGNRGSSLSAAAVDKADGTHVQREFLNLPLSVDATIHTTSMVKVDEHGDTTIQTTTSSNELIELMTPDFDISDSEVDRIIEKPDEERTKAEKDLIYAKVASTLSKIASQSQAAKSSTSIPAAAKTPVDDGSGFIHGSIPARPEMLRPNALKLSPSPNLSPRHLLPGASSRAPVEEPPVNKETVSIEQALSALLREKGDELAKNCPDLVMRAGQEILSYQSFENLANGYVDPEPTFSGKLATLFSFATTAVRYAGKTGQIAVKVQEYVVTYFAEKMAVFIDSNGGWESVIEESSSDID